VKLVEGHVMPDHVRSVIGDSAKIQCVPHDQEVEREINDPSASEIWAQAEFYWS